MADLNKIVDDLSSLSVLEAAELSKMLEDKWGVSAAAPVAVAAAPAAGAGEAAAEENNSADDINDAILNLGTHFNYASIASDKLLWRYREGCGTNIHSEKGMTLDFLPHIFSIMYLHWGE